MKKVTKRSVVYLEPALHKAARVKAVHTRRSMSAVVNEAVRNFLYEDQQDLAAFAARRNESTMSFEALLKGLKLQAPGSSPKNELLSMS